ncbi:MAG: uracil-DNA glycosylase [Desulfurococcales archaeon]|nr:uracil-DNA glycosylase [Desulfurococcales archaeon]
MSVKDRNGYEDLVKTIKSCTRCPLHASRKNAVPGEGPLDAEVMVVGEAPGRSEDEQGRPFVGAAGKLLDRLLGEAGLERGRVYITNIVKCRPPNNRDPKPEEIQACLPYLIEQIKTIRPKVIIAVGRIAGSTLYKLAGLRWEGVRRERGRIVRARIGGVDVVIVPTYHPAAALYNPQLRGELEEDFKGPVKRAVREAGRGRKPPTLEDFME